MSKQWCDSFSSDSVAVVETEEGLTSVQVDNALASAQILLQGAQVLSFTPKGKQDLLWVSDDARYVRGRPVRGGVPICWPWFGASIDQSQVQAHGFARNFMWELEEVTDRVDGATELLFTLNSSDESRQLWPHLFRLQYRVVVGQSLELSLTTTNMGSEPWVYTEALHSYLAVQSIEGTHIRGLSGIEYQDKLSTDKSLSRQDGDLQLTGEVDRVYLTGCGQASDRDCEVSDSTSGEAIRVRSSGSSTTVVWNPWIAKAEALADFANSGYKTMLCIEAANTEPSPIKLAPGQSHTLRQTLSLL